MSIARSFFMVMFAGALLSGCAVGPDYKAPTIGLPGVFSNKDKAAAALPMQDQAQIQELSHWWTSFEDPTLNMLVAKGLNGNHSLKSVQARIDEARGIRRSAFGGLWPAIGASANVSRDKANTRLGTGFFNQRQAGFDASWEVDLFGGNRRALESADADVMAAIADTDAAALSLAAEIAVQYIEYRNVQQQLQIAQSSVKAQDEILQLTKDLFSADLTSGLEVSQAESVARTTAAAVPEYQRQLEATRQSLAVLTGGTADELPMDVLSKPAPVPMAKTMPFLEAPTSVLSRRPDIVASERRLASATALTGAEMAALYPSLNLSGFFGLGGGTGARNANVWTLAAGVAAPLLNFGTIQGRVDAQEARQMQAYHNYRQTVLEAVADVETSLSNFAYGTQYQDALQKSAASNRETLRLARLRYENGLTPFTDVLNAQQDSYQTDQEMARSQALRSQALVGVYKSLGVAPRFLPRKDD